MIFDGDVRGFRERIVKRGYSDFEKENPGIDISKGIVMTSTIVQGVGWFKIYNDVVNGELVKTISIHFENKAIMYFISSIMNTWSKYV